MEKKNSCVDILQNEQYFSSGRYEGQKRNRCKTDHLLVDTHFFRKVKRSST